MNINEAVSWIQQPGIMNAMPQDPHTKEAINLIIRALNRKSMIVQKEVLQDFIGWFVEQYACGIDGTNGCLVVGRKGKYVNALRVYMEENNDEH